MPQTVSAFDEIRSILGEAGQAQQAQQDEQTRNLLTLAQQEHLRVTSGFSHGGHNTGSMHYQGTPDDPGAIDVDPSGMTPQRIAQLQAQGFTVRDERTHPAGQAVWTGPHYHIQKPRDGQAPQHRDMLKQAPAATPQQPDMLVPSIPRGATVIPVDGMDFNVPTQAQAQATNAARTKELTPAPVSLSAISTDTKPTGNDFDAIRTILAQAGKAQPAPAAPVTHPQTNFIGDLANHFGNAVTGFTQDQAIRHSGHGVGAFLGDMAGQIVDVGGATIGGGAVGGLVAPVVGAPIGAAAGGITAAGGLGAAQDLQEQRLAGAKQMDYGRALTSGVIQGGLQAIPVVGEAAPLLKRLAANAALHGTAAGVGSLAQQAAEQHTLTPRVDLGRVGQMATLGAAGGSVGALMHGAKPGRVDMLDGSISHGFVDRNGQPIMPPEYQGPQHGMVRKGGQEINPALTPHEQAQINVKPKTEMLGTPQASKELNQGFTQRVYDASGQPQVIDPRTAAIPDELGPVKTETTPSGLQVVTKARQKERPQIEMGAALPGKAAPYTLQDGYLTGSDGSTTLGRVKLSEGRMEAQPQHGEFRDDLPIMMEEGKRNSYTPDGTLTEKGFGYRHKGEGEHPGLADNKRRRLEEAGFSSEEEMIDHVSKNYKQIYEQPPKEGATEPRYLLVDPDRNVALEVVEFRRGDGQDYYGVTTSFAAGDLKYPSKKGSLIWEKDPTLAQSADTLTSPDSAARLESDNAVSSGSGDQSRNLDPNVAHGQADLNPPTGGTPLPSTRELALRRADEISNRIEMLDPKGVKGKPTAQATRKVDLLDSQGRPMNAPRETPQLDLLKPTPTDPANLELPKPFERSAPAAPEAAPPPAAEGVTLNPEKPITPEMAQAAEAQKQTMMTMAEAEQFIQKHQPDQMTHFLNAMEAGRNNQTLDVSHSPLEHGGRVTNQREVNPVGFAKQTISPKTEVSNLRKQYEGDLNAVRDNLVQRLNEAGVKINAADQRMTGTRSDVTRLNALAAKLPAEKLTHVYVMDHNLGETARKEGPYGFRRIDRISDSSLTGKPQALPEGTANTNKIAPAFQVFHDLVNAPDAPASLKRVSKQIDGGNISRQSYKDLAQAYRDLTPEKLAEVCKRFGI